MPAFRYEASDVQGRVQNGLIEAENERMARQALRGRGLLPLTLKAAHSAASSKSALRTHRRIKDAELCWMTRQLASLLGAGLPLDTALSATLEQAQGRHLTDVLASVRADVRSGHRLGQAFAAHPVEFPAIYRALIDAGEASGDLSRVMENLADYLESRSSLHNKVLTAFIYPAIVTLVSIGIVVFLLSYVVPQVVGAFSQTNQTLPLLTRFMLAASDAVREWGPLAALGVVIALGLWRWQLRRPKVKLSWHSTILRLPVVGYFVSGVNTARYAATLAILTGGGVPLLAALDAAGRTLSNARLRLAADEAAQRVRAGSPLAAALQAQGTFPALLTYLVSSGERTGELPAMLQRASQTLSAQLERRAMAMTALLEPLMILIMGAIVLVIVLAVMMPIIEINQMSF
ncbi:type II secretion system inner membrane protein GspF [Bordetella sp. 15P40C-2]|uniref:type II secretion system inner membrane protein GspF n=1 Tax=Bordetella sp. 15P40C-2 TaxID=2572246 RepID=UPI001325D782|nr:type II secretion system inner membrane protein GspF [Bordetella sp. 15P40C-2]MVW72500.1 type II secretion system inner membrane protein GspF [Bordetella sp. 15P40C-2]